MVQIVYRMRKRTSARFSRRTDLLSKRNLQVQPLVETFCRRRNARIEYFVDPGHPTYEDIGLSRSGMEGRTHRRRWSASGPRGPSRCTPRSRTRPPPRRAAKSWGGLTDPEGAVSTDAQGTADTGARRGDHPIRRGRPRSASLRHRPSQGLEVGSDAEPGTHVCGTGRRGDRKNRLVPGGLEPPLPT
jgi:hypothetical protein